MDVKEALQEAVSAVEEVNVPDGLREIAFTKVLETLLCQSIDGRVQPPLNHQATALPNNSSGAQVAEGDDLIERLAAILGIETTIVGRVFSEVDGAPFVSLPSSALPNTKSAATKDIALLTVLARQTLGLDDFTHVDEVRKVAEHFNRYDSSNFAGTISNMISFLRFQGKGQNRKLKLNQPGKEAAIELLKKYGGNER